MDNRPLTRSRKRDLDSGASSSSISKRKRNEPKIPFLEPIPEINASIDMELNIPSEDDIPLLRRSISRSACSGSSGQRQASSSEKSISIEAKRSLPNQEHFNSDVGDDDDDDDDWTAFDNPRAHEKAQTGPIGNTVSSSQPSSNSQSFPCSNQTPIYSPHHIPTPASQTSESSSHTSDSSEHDTSDSADLPEVFYTFNSMVFDNRIHFARYCSLRSKSILTGSCVNFHSISHWHFLKLFQFQGWTNFLTLSNPTYDLPTRCFYANLRKENNDAYSTYFRGLRFSFNSEDLSEIIGAPNEGLDIYDLTLSKFPFVEPECLNSAVSCLFSSNPKNVNTSDGSLLSPISKFMANLLSKTVLPKGGDRLKYTGCHMVLTYCILKKIKVNLNLLILKEMEHVQSTKKSLYFGKVISLLYEKNGVKVNCHSIIKPDTDFSQKNASLAKLVPPLIFPFSSSSISSSESEESADIITSCPESSSSPFQTSALPHQTSEPLLQQTSDHFPSVSEFHVTQHTPPQNDYISVDSPISSPLHSPSNLQIIVHPLFPILSSSILRSIVIIDLISPQKSPQESHHTETTKYPSSDHLLAPIATPAKPVVDDFWSLSLLDEMASCKNDINNLMSSFRSSLKTAPSFTVKDPALCQTSPQLTSPVVSQTTVLPAQSPAPVDLLSSPSAIPFPKSPLLSDQTGAPPPISTSNLPPSIPSSSSALPPLNPKQKINLVALGEKIAEQVIKSVSPMVQNLVREELVLIQNHVREEIGNLHHLVKEELGLFQHQARQEFGLVQNQLHQDIAQISNQISANILSIIQTASMDFGNRVHDDLTHVIKFLTKCVKDLKKIKTHIGIPTDPPPHPPPGAEGPSS